MIEGIGGEDGWYSLPLACEVRGRLDALAGGVGLRRGRRDPARLDVGESLDWWRVEQIVPGALLRLRAEMLAVPARHRAAARSGVRGDAAQRRGRRRTGRSRPAGCVRLVP